MLWMGLFSSLHQHSQWSIACLVEALWQVYIILYIYNIYTCIIIHGDIVAREAQHVDRENYGVCCFALVEWLFSLEAVYAIPLLVESEFSATENTTKEIELKTITMSCVCMYACKYADIYMYIRVVMHPTPCCAKLYIVIIHVQSFMHTSN